MVRSHRLSMSRMALARQCAYGFRADVEARPRPSGRPARVGSLVHLFVEQHVRGETVEIPAGADPHEAAEARSIFEGPLRSWLGKQSWTSVEAGLRYDAGADSCSDGPRRGEPGYEEVGAMVLPGTLDLVRVDGAHGVVRDVKSGKPPEDREQLYAQAVAASRRWKLETVEVGYVRALKTKVEELDVEMLDVDRLDAEAGRISGLLRRLPMAEPVPGDRHCWKCDARGVCPAFMAPAEAEPPPGFFEDHP